MEKFAKRIEPCCKNPILQHICQYESGRINDGTWYCRQADTYWCSNCGALHQSRQLGPYEEFTDTVSHPISKVL